MAFTAAVLVASGYVLMALTYEGILANSSYILMSIYFCLAGIGSAAANLSGLTVNIRNFGSRYRGFLVGVLAALFGLSALIFTQLHSALFVDRSTNPEYEAENQTEDVVY